eukprot:364092-Chlamydomonas_euryale.AAC.6
MLRSASRRRVSAPFAQRTERNNGTGKGEALRGGERARGLMCAARRGWVVRGLGCRRRRTASRGSHVLHAKIPSVHAILAMPGRCRL